MTAAFQRPTLGRLLLLSGGAAFLAILYLAAPKSPLNRFEVEQVIKKHFYAAVVEAAELKPHGKSLEWHVRFTTPPLSNASLLIVDAKDGAIVRMTRWPADVQVPAPRFGQP